MTQKIPEILQNALTSTTFETGVEWKLKSLNTLLKNLSTGDSIEPQSMYALTSIVRDILRDVDDMKIQADTVFSYLWKIDNGGVSC